MMVIKIVLKNSGCKNVISSNMQFLINDQFVLMRHFKLNICYHLNVLFVVFNLTANQEIVIVLA